MKMTIAVALSGGIDSLVAAHLLDQKGYRVIGVHFLTGFETDDPQVDRNRAIARAQTLLEPISAQLQIPLHVIDLTDHFQQQVIDYFVNTYQLGQTPNPCLVCNPAIKFGLLADYARSLGAQALATGHYARSVKRRDGVRQLYKGADPQKDQSYFLARLTRDQLSFTRFPLANLQKRDTVAYAQQRGLQPLTKEESQDICFIKNSSYGDFLRKQPGFSVVPGPIMDMSGQVIGSHDGLYQYTVGQRRGINIPAAAPYYVVHLDPSRHRLMVGSKRALDRTGCHVSQINWLIPAPTRPFKAGVRLRYRHKEVLATIVPERGNSAMIRFDTPQRAITPGQGAIFYQDDMVLGGGWIDPCLPESLQQT